MDDYKYSEVEHLKRRAHTLRLGLHQRLDEIYVSDFPGGNPQSFIELFQKILDKISDEIDNTENLDIVALICQFIQRYGGLLQFLDNAHTAQTPRGLVLMLEDLITKLTPGVELLAWPQSEYNYSIIDILKTIKNSTSNLFTEEVQRNLFNDFHNELKLISFPRIERDDILVHAVFGHEIGHPIADQFILLEEKDEKYQKDLAKAREAITVAFKDDFEQLNKNETFIEMQQLLDLLINIRKRGLEELISDCVAIYLFGPSALFAAYDIFSPEDLDSSPRVPDLYPPSRMRLRLSKQLMDKEGYTARLNSLEDNKVDKEVNISIRSFINHLDIIIGVTDDRDKINKDPLLKIAYDWLLDSFEQAIEFAKDKVKNIIYDPDKINQEIPDLLRRLELGLPPNEVGVYPDCNIADWRSAILSAWIYRINKVESSTALDLTSDIEHLHKVTLRAIENIMLQTKYKNTISKAS